MSQCLQVLDQPDSPLEPPGWNHARLYFDGGARGNPGPGGGGWTLVTQDSHTNEWVLTACGYAYKGTSVTNNYCEYAALQDGLAHARTELEHTATHLEVYGDSNMIIDARNGYATLVAPHLQNAATNVDRIASNIAWISWKHVKREYNKMADYLANVAMDSRGTRTLRETTTGPDSERFKQARHLLENDIQGSTSRLRHTSLIKILRQFQGS